MTAVQRPDDRRIQRPSRFGSATLRQRLGAVLLVAVILAVVAVELWPDNSPTPPPENLTVVKGYGGGLKVDFLTDPDVSRILADLYQLQVDIGAVGSNDIACNIELGPDDDFVWLGDSVVLELYKSCGGVVLSNDTIYYSPIVLYSWAPVVDALVAAGLAQIQADGSYSLDFAALVALIENGETWESIGLPQLHGAISVQTSDPQRSNSGFLFAGLLANTINGGSVVNATTVEPLLPRIQSFFQASGYMPPRSSDLWNLFIATGMGAKPIVALYESQIIEHIVANPTQLTQINRDIRILYPEPTVWATHPYVARTSEGEALMRALKDPDIQRLAADNHGHRPSVSSVPFAPAVTGIRREISSVVGMPAPDAMDKIIDAIAAVPNVPTPTPASSPSTSTNTSLASTWPTASQAQQARRRRSKPTKVPAAPAGTRARRAGLSRGRE